MPTYDPFRIAAAHLEAWNNRNVQPFKDLLAPTATIRYDWEKEERAALESLEEYQKIWLTAFPDARWTHTNIMPAGGTLVFEWTCTGTHKGTFQGIPPSGRMGAVRGTSVFKLNEDGKIVKETVYLDLANLLGELGVLPPPLDAARLKELTLAYLEVWNKRDMPELQRFYAPDHTAIKEDGVIMKAAEHMEWLTRYFLAFPDSKVQLTHLAVRGNEVLAECVVTATHRSPFWGLAATNRPVRWETAVIVTFQGDKIVKQAYYNDAYTLLAQIGAAPEFVTR